MTIDRRKLITGLISFVAAPAIVRVASIMPVKVIDKVMTTDDYLKMIDKLYENSQFGKLAGPIVKYSYNDYGLVTEIVPLSSLYKL